MNAQLKIEENSIKTYRLNDRIKDKIFLVTLLLPAMLLLLLTIFIPIVKSVYMSLFNVSLITIGESQWAGLNNFREIFADDAFTSALKNTLSYAFSTVAILLVLGMCMALILNMNLRGRRFLRSVILIPWIVPTIVVALLWMWIFQPQYGVMNYILMSLGIFSEPHKWVADPALAMPSVMVAALWRQLPFMAMMLLAGLQGIPEDMYEAATIDGAGNVQMFLHVTLPFLRNVIKTTTLVSIIENFKMFPMFWIMTGGGPMNKTTTLAILSYQTAFTNLNLGKGAAIGVLWLLLLVGFSWGYNKLLAGKEM